jgi:hypothetical protein
MKSRAIRRHHMIRLKKKYSKYYGGYAKTERQIGRLYQTPTPCSCLMCGNRRKWEGITRQEKISILEMQEELEEIAS